MKCDICNNIGDIRVTMYLDCEIQDGRGLEMQKRLEMT